MTTKASVLYDMGTGMNWRLKFETEQVQRACANRGLEKSGSNLFSDLNIAEMILQIHTKCDLLLFSGSKSDKSNPTMI